MAKATLDQIKKLRAKTKAGVMDCRKALEASGGDMAKAEKWLLKKGMAKAAKRTGRETTQGLVKAYTHHSGAIGAVVAVACETDFVAKTDDFKTLVAEIAMQVAATNPGNVKALLKEPWIRDEKKTIGELVKGLAGKTGENIVVKEIKRLDLKGK